MSFLDDIFGGGQAQGYGDLNNYLHQGMGALNNYYNKAVGYENPYYQAGLNNLSRYQNALGQMADPSAYYNNVMSGYQESPGAKFQMQNATNAVNSRAAATGLNGSSNNLDDISKITQGITNQDQQQYFNNINNLHQQYLGGLGNLEGQGFQSANNLGNWALGMGGNLANLYGEMGQAQAGQDEARANADEGLLGTIGHFFY